MILIYMAQTIQLFDKRFEEIVIPEGAVQDMSARGYAKFVLK